MSFLLSQGHTDASHYPLAMLWSEVDIARRRVNLHMATESTLMQAVIGAVLNNKDGGKHYRKLLKGLTNG